MPKSGRRPHVWLSGPDPALHDEYHRWSQARNQARWRGEEWLITWPEWQQIWQGRMAPRGRHSQSPMLVRQDSREPWSITNVEIRTRAQHNRLVHTGRRRRGI